MSFEGTLGEIVIVLLSRTEKQFLSYFHIFQCLLFFSFDFVLCLCWCVKSSSCIGSFVFGGKTTVLCIAH